MTGKPLRAALLAALLVLSVVGGTIAFAGAAGASSHSVIEVRDFALGTHEADGDAGVTASWTTSGAFIEVDDPDADWSSAGNPNAGDEARIAIQADDVGVTTLGDLNTLSWGVAGGVGYAPHVDVFVDTDGDDTAEDAIVFEYAKVDPNDCDDTGDYPTGDFNTFADKGTVDSSAVGWLASGAAGPCGDPAFINGTLAEWQAGNVTNDVNASTTVTHFEVEVDNWVYDPSSATVSNVTVNGQTYHGQIQRGVDMAASGDTVAVGAGTYQESVTVDKSLTVTGTSHPTLDANDAPYGFEVTADNVTIDHFTIVGTAASSAAEGSAVFASQVQHLTLSNLEAFDHPGKTIQVVKSHQVHIENVLVDNGGLDGIIAYKSVGVTIEDSTVTNTGYDFDSLQSGSHTADSGIYAKAIDLTIRNTTVAANQGEGIYVHIEDVASWLGDVPGAPSSFAAADGVWLEAIEATSNEQGVDLWTNEFHATLANANVHSNDQANDKLHADGVAVTGNNVTIQDSTIESNEVSLHNYRSSSYRDDFRSGDPFVSGGVALANISGDWNTQTQTQTVVKTVVDHVHHHHGGGGTQVIEKTVTVPGPSPTPRVETVEVTRTVEVPGPERTVTVVQPSPTPREVERTVTVTVAPGQPGFGAALAIVALLAAGLLALRRRD